MKADWESRESLFVNQLSGKSGLTKIFWSLDNICVHLIEKISETLDTSTITKCADWVEFPTKILLTAGINTCRQRRKQCKHQLKTGCRETMNIEHSLLTESKERREEGVT